VPDDGDDGDDGAASTGVVKDDFRTCSLFTLYSGTVPGCKLAYAYQVR
jgi:hypothetical protein